jgi:hypothetical protein
VVLARASTGAVLLRAAVGGYGVQGLGVGDDGTVAWISASAATGCQGTLYAISIARPEPRALTGAGTPCPFGSYPGDDADIVDVVGERVVYPSTSGWAISDGGGGARVVAGIPTGDGGTGQIAFDGRTLYGVTRDCDAERLLAVDVDEPGSAPRGAARPAFPQPCPVALEGSARLRVGTPRTATVRLRCPIGCHGALRLIQQHGVMERVAGSADVLGRGTITARVPLARYAAGLAACGNGLRVRAAFFQQPVRTAYAPRVRHPVSVLRLRAAGPCRRRPAPPFAPPILFG